MIILPWEKGNGKRSRHAAVGWLDVMRTGGGFQLPGKLISLRHDSFPVESLERRRLLSISRSQKPHTCPCSSATHSRQSRWRSRPGPRPRSRSRSLGPTALSLDLDLGLDLTCPQGLSSSRLKAQDTRLNASPVRTNAKRFQRRRRISFPGSQQLTARGLRPFTYHSATGSRGGAAGDLDPQGLRPHLSRYRPHAP